MQKPLDAEGCLVVCTKVYLDLSMLCCDVQRAMDESRSEVDWIVSSVKMYDGRQKTDSKCYFSITHSSLLQMDGIYVLQISSSQLHFVLAVCVCVPL